MNNLFESAKKIIKDKAKHKITIAILSTLAPYLLIVFSALLMIFMFIAPIAEGLNRIDAFSDKVSIFFEKVGNMLAGRHFRIIDQTAIQEKEDEFNTLLGEYYLEYLREGDVEIDAPLILATVYYPLGVAFDEDMIAGGDKEEDKERYDYLREKIKKLPDLIRRSIAMYTTEYECEEYTYTNSKGEKVTKYSRGKQVGPSEKTYPFDGNWMEDESCNSTDNIKVYTYEVDVEEYDNYLKDEYIPISPEYNMPKDLDETEQTYWLDQKVIAIHDLSELYYYLFEPSVLAQNVYGEIPYNILQQMVLPVDPSIGPDGKGMYKITSCYTTYNRILDNGVSRPHHGIDVVDKGDRNVRAAADGVIVKAVGTNNFNCYLTQCENMDGRGNFVEIVHEIDGVVFTTKYLHLESVSVSVGDVVKAGDFIGVQGNTGHSQAEHLHFEYRDEKGNSRNPGNLFTNPLVITAKNCLVPTGTGTCTGVNSSVVVSPSYGEWNGQKYPISVRVNGKLYPLEQYVLGVTLNEIVPEKYDIEAIKAQMVAARTYTFGAQRYRLFKLENDIIVIDMGVASEYTQTFAISKFCSFTSGTQSKMLQALDDTRGEILVDLTSNKMFSSEYSACAANDGYKTLGEGYVCKLPGCDKTIKAHCTSNSCHTTSGNVCGHGRGLSQDGADALAKKSYYNYTKILDYYYYGKINYLSDMNVSGYEKIKK